MVASNKERQAAFRARKKMQSLADKRFEGEHFVTLGEFLRIMKFDEEKFITLLPEGRVEGPPPNLVTNLLAEIHEFQEQLVEEKLKQDGFRMDCEKLALVTAEDNFFIKDTKEWSEFMHWELRAVAGVKVKSEIDAFEKQLYEDNAQAIEKAERDHTEFPLYQLVNAYKRSLDIP